MHLPTYVKFDQTIINVVYRAKKLDGRVHVTQATVSIDGRNVVSFQGPNGCVLELVRNNSSVLLAGEQEVTDDVESVAREIVKRLTT